MINPPSNSQHESNVRILKSLLQGTCLIFPQSTLAPWHFRLFTPRCRLGTQPLTTTICCVSTVTFSHFRSTVHCVSFGLLWWCIITAGLLMGYSSCGARLLLHRSRNSICRLSSVIQQQSSRLMWVQSNASANVTNVKLYNRTGIADWNVPSYVSITVQWVGISGCS